MLRTTHTQCKDDKLKSQSKNPQHDTETHTTHKLSNHESNRRKLRNTLQASTTPLQQQISPCRNYYHRQHTHTFTHTPPPPPPHVEPHALLHCKTLNPTLPEQHSNAYSGHTFNNKCQRRKSNAMVHTLSTLNFYIFTATTFANICYKINVYTH